MKRRGMAPSSPTPMKPRSLAPPERLEKRYAMDADIQTMEFLPSTHGTAEASAAQWQSVISATHANIIHHFENDQAGEQHHLWSANFYGWEGIAEFDPSLPEGAVIDGAMLRVLIMNAEDTMNRQPSLVAHLSSQDQAGDIVASEYNNAGAALGSAPFAQMAPGAYVDIPLDPSLIPTTGAISLSLRTSDQVAGTQPATDHNSRSVVTYSGMKLELRYHVPDTNPEPDIANDIVLPEELTNLLAEAIALSRNGPEWRTPETGEAVASSLRKGLHVNLRGADAPVVGLRATVTANGAAITASVYRGTELLATVPVPADGRFAYSYESGFTDVLFTTANAAAISSTGLEITTDESMPPITGGDVGIMTSKPYALAAAPVVPIPNDVAYVAGTLKFTTSSSIGTDSRRYIVRDPSLFTLIKVNASGGTGRITMVGTIKKEGVDYRGREYGSTSGFPEGYARWISDGIVAIAPGAPAPISFIASGPGTFSVTHGQTLEELLPPSTMSAATLDTDLMKMNDQFQTPGVFPPLTEVREGSSPVFSNPGDIANVQYHVRNAAIAGGQVTARIYVGWYSGEPTRGTLQQTETLVMSGNQTQRISANVTAPAKPADATSNRPIISVILTLPNGTASVANSKLGKLPISHEKRIYTKNADGTTTMHIESGEYTRREQARIHELTDRALNALLSSNDSRLVAARTALGDDHIVELIAKNTAAALAVADQQTNVAAIDLVMATLDEGMEKDVEDTFLDREGFGGGPDTPATAEKLLSRAFANGGTETSEAREAATTIANGGLTPRNMYAQILGWTVPQNELMTALSAVRDTLSGKVLKNGFGHMWDQRGNRVAQWMIAFQLQMVTDIPASMLMNAMNKGSANDVKNACLSMLQLAQYGSLLQSTVEPSMPTITMAEPNKLTYVTGDTHVRIRFDIAGTTSGVRNVRVYDGDSLVAIGGATGYVNVPIADLPQRGAMSTSNVMSSTTYNLRIELTLQNGQQASRSATPISMHPNLPGELHAEREAANNRMIIMGNYSTNLDSERAAFENEVLSSMKMPVIAGGWTSVIGSSKHDGQNLFALDLSKTNDTGTTMKIPASGWLHSVNVDAGRVILKHKTPSGRIWYTQYEHMTNILEGLTGIAYIGKKEAAGLSPEAQTSAAETRAHAQAILTTMAQSSMWLEQGSDMAKLGNEGAYTTGSHIHQSLYDESGNPIDQYKWANEWQPGITHSADAGNKEKLTFAWDTTVNALVDRSNGIAMQRVNAYDNEGKVTGGVNLAFALEGVNVPAMRRIVWEFIKEKNHPDGISRWRDVNDKSRYWNGTEWLSTELL